MAFGKKKKGGAEGAAEKKKKATGGEEGGKKSKKKLLIPVIVLLLAAGGAYRFGLLDRFMGGGDGAAKATVPDAVDTYVLNEESVASLTAAFEGVGDELLLSISSNAIPADTTEQDAAADQSADAADETTDTTTDTTTQTPATEEDPYSNYYYKVTGDTADDLVKYAEYLTTSGDTGGGFTRREDTGDASDGVMTFEKTAASVSGKLLILEIENPLNGDAATEMFSIKLRLEEKQEPLQEGVTRDEALKYFEGLNYELLGLDKPISDYYLVMDMGRTYIDKNDCYGISLYNKGTGEESYFVKKFYLSVEKKKLYEYLAGDLVGLQENYTVNQGGEVLSSVENGGLHEDTPVADSSQTSL